MAKADTFKKNRAQAQTDYITKYVDPLLKKDDQGLHIGADITNYGYRINGTPARAPELPIRDNFTNTVDHTQPQAQAPFPAFQEAPQRVSNRKDGSFVTFDPESNQGSAQEFIASFVNRAPRGIQQLSDGGVLFSDGVIRYNDGTERAGDTNAQPVQQLPDGSVRYSDGSIKAPTPQGVQQLPDGSVLFSDGSIRRGMQQFANFPELSQAILGGDYPVTQAYNNFNPNMGYVNNRNRGTDIGVRNQPLVLPFNGRVVEITRDDGSRWGDQSGHQGYGNSVLVQLDTGEMLRFAHLSNFNVNVGDTIQAGQSFGVTGATGNVTGPHLDLEYYNANGQLDNPNNFQGFANPEVLGASISANSYEVIPQDQYTPEQSQAAGAPNKSTQINQSVQPQQPTQIPTTQPTAAQEVANNVRDVTQNIEARGRERNAPELFVGEAGRLASDVASGNISKQEVGQRIGSGLEQIGEKANAPELSLSELASGKISPKEFLGRTAKSLGAKELGASIQQADSASDFVSDYGKRTNAPELGASELLNQVNPDVIRGAANTAVDQVVNTGSSLVDKAKNSLSGFIDSASQVAKNILPNGVFGVDTRAIGDSPTGGNAASSGQQTQPLQPQDATSSTEGEVLGSSTTDTPFTEDAYKGIFNPDRSLSPLEQRLATMGSEGKDAGNDNKFAKLYRRYQELQNKYGSAPSSATATGYASPEADKAAQKENAQKQDFYSGKYGDTGGSYNAFIKSGGPTTFNKSDLKNSTANDIKGSSLPDIKIDSGYAKQIQNTVGVRNGSGVLTTEDIGKVEKISTPAERVRAGTTFNKKKTGRASIDASGNIVFLN